mmetsp:Transcript_7495/g.12994  ORF Transcript_7495/g.12994 Transcript_7495/m.12994 type:complete len:287 (+) Transcript_7495:1098-1958(+)
MVAQGIGVGRQLRAFQEDRADHRVLLDQIQRHLDDAGLHDVQGHFLSLGHGVEARNILAAMDDKAVLLHIKATTRHQDLLLRFQRMLVGREDHNLIVWVKCGSNDGTLHHRGHKNGLCGNLPRKHLKCHHETAITGDGTDSSGLQVLNGIREASLHLLGELTRLTHLEAQARNTPEVDIIAEACGMVGVPWSRRIVVVQSHHTKGWVLHLLLGYGCGCSSPVEGGILEGVQELLVSFHEIRVLLLQRGVGLKQVMMQRQHLLMRLPPTIHFLRIHSLLRLTWCHLK